MIPRHIAICGAPTAGKDAIAEILVRRYGHTHVDTARPLRDMTKVAYGLSEQDVATQEGKLKLRTVLGREYTHRQLQGDLGMAIEGFYGTQWMAERAIESAERTPGEHAAFVYSGCRRDQGKSYLAAGGIVVQVIRPGVFPIHEFDHYDLSLITHSVANGGTLEDLERNVVMLFDSMMEG